MTTLLVSPVLRITAAYCATLVIGMALIIAADRCPSGTAASRIGRSANSAARVIARDADPALGGRAPHAFAGILQGETGASQSQCRTTRAAVHGAARNRGAALVGRGVGPSTAANCTEAFDSETADTLKMRLSGLALSGAGCAAMIGLALRRRIELLSSAAEELAQLDGGDRGAAPAPPGEFRRLSLALKSLGQRLEAERADAAEAAAVVAHDLRRPLARVRSLLDVGLMEVGRADQRACMERALAACDELADLLGSLLRISRLETRTEAPAMSIVDLAELATTVYDDYEPAIRDGGRTISLMCEGTVVAWANGPLLAQALANLLDNAQLHTPVGSNIVIIADGVDGRVRLAVADDGPGVPSEALPRLTERFFRAGRGGDVPGHGLGLSMVAAVARIHSGRIEVSDLSPGLRIELSFHALATGVRGEHADHQSFHSRRRVLGGRMGGQALAA